MAPLAARRQCVPLRFLPLLVICINFAVRDWPYRRPWPRLDAWALPVASPFPGLNRCGWWALVQVILVGFFPTRVPHGPNVAQGSVVLARSAACRLFPGSDRCMTIIDARFACLRLDLEFFSLRDVRDPGNISCAMQLPLRLVAGALATPACDTYAAERKAPCRARAGQSGER